MNVTLRNYLHSVNSVFGESLQNYSKYKKGRAKRDQSDREDVAQTNLRSGQSYTSAYLLRLYV
jgi:hypothetical protein